MPRKKAEPPAEPEKKPAAKPRSRSGSNKAKNSVERLKREATVITERARGSSWATVAKVAGVSDGHARRVWRAFVAAGKLEIQKEDPVAIVFEQITRLDQAIEELSEIGRNGDNDSARVGAIRVKSQLIAQEIELLQAVGLMPKNLGRIRIEVEQRYVLQQLMIFVKEYVPAERIESAEDRLIELFKRDRPPQLELTEAVG